jgi:ubiquinone/menaquinone biosynthesis C-methylase UbiE
MDSSDALKEQYRDSGNFVQRLELHRRFGTNRYGWYRWVVDQFDLGRDRRILELGCGPGALWKRNLERTRASTFIVLSDFSAGMLRDSAHNLGADAERVRFCQLDARLLPFRDRTFDAVVANMMLYHVADRANAIRDIRRVLTEEGRLYASTTGNRYMREINEAAWRILEVPPRGTSADRFGLESGYDQLRAVFPRVETRRYESTLHVTEAGPLMDYFLSMRPMIYPAQDRWNALRSYFAERIARDGEITIPMDIGMLIASLD